MWGPLLEKAMAKIGANYGNIKGGFSSHASRAILGCPVFGQKITQGDMILTDAAIHYWNMMYHDRHTRGIMHTAIISESADPNINHCGFTMNHVYSVLDIFGLVDPITLEIDHRMLIVRDPRASS